MNYIGSKYSLLPEIQRVLAENAVPATGIALDIFAGTSAVAQFLKQRGHVVYANDWQHYSYLTCAALIELNSMPLFEKLLEDRRWGELIRQCLPLAFPLSSINSRKQTALNIPATQVLSYLTQLPGIKGAFFDAYCEGGKSGRLYFSEENGRKIQAIRDQIEQWYAQRLVSHQEHAWLVASLIEGADHVANTASVYGAYLKKVKKTARRPLRLYVLEPVSSIHAESEHKAFCEDGEKLLRELSNNRLQLVYIDPPYNARQYNANYHILETIAKWDMGTFEPKGVTGLRSHKSNTSAYCSKRQVEEAFRALISKINAEYVLFSYNNEGILPKEQLEAIFRDYCAEVIFEEIPYKRFRADNDGENRVYKGDSTIEFLVLGKLKPFAGAPVSLP
ncbi:MAG: DNA adenine methylase [Armatimonadetes bacterium]|nr:DNA adenine methylase [Armatimonadota bacterium]